MQKRALTALIVLAALGFGLLAGAHPCSAWQERGETPASCHAGPTAMQEDDSSVPGRAGVLPHERDSSDPAGGCGTSCQHACHMTAVAEACGVAFAIAPVAQALAEASGSGLSRFAHPIDHVPLA